MSHFSYLPSFPFTLLPSLLFPFSILPLSLPSFSTLLSSLFFPRAATLLPSDLELPPHKTFSSHSFQVSRVPQVYIFQFNAPLYFGNVGVFRSRLYIETGVNPSEFEEVVVGCFKQCCTQVRRELRVKGKGEMRVGGVVANHVYSLPAPSPMQC